MGKYGLVEYEFDQDGGIVSFEENNYRKRDNPVRRMIIWSLLSIFIAVSVQIFLQNYLPPAPPPNALEHPTWSQYLFHNTKQLIDSSSALFLDTPWHITKWSALHFKVHLEDTVTSLQKRFEPKCELRYHLDAKDKLQEAIVGQNLALQSVSQLLGSWEGDRPLTLALVGSTSTGRFTLVQRLSQILFSHCSKSQQSKAFLTIDGNEYQPDDHGTLTAAKTKLAYEIHRHVKSCSDHSIVAIQNASRMNKQVLSWLLREIRKENTFDEVEMDGVAFKRMILFVILDDTGLTRIIGGNTDGGAKPELMTSPQLFADIAFAIDDLYGAGASELVDGMIPFSPLGPDDLASILKRRVMMFAEDNQSSWVLLQVDEDVIHTLVDERHVEYLTVYDSDPETATRVPRYTFASAGAASTSTSLQRIKSEVRRCTANRKLSKHTVRVVFEGDGRAIIRHCESESVCDPVGCRFDL